MKLALVQMRCFPGEVDRNVAATVDGIRRAAERSCDLVVFPEMSDTGYHMPTIVNTAGTWDGGAYAAVATAAATYGITVVAGLSERVGDDLYNSLAVFGTDGELLAKYRKIHLITAEPVCEHRTIRPGREVALCTIAGVPVGLMTCYDIRFPELARKLALAGAELLIVPAAFPLVRTRHWEILTASRAIENQVYVAAVNRVGEDAGLAFGGASRLLDPYGTVLGSASEIEETMIVGDISREKLRQFRDRMKVFQDRREDVYR